MLTIKKAVDITCNYSLSQDYDKDRILYFDIETTGFPPKTTYLYMIGCIYYKESSYHLIQWFAENIEEETLLISAFFDFLEDYDVLVHYNGLGFDIPYINKKCSHLTLNYSFRNITHIDIYKEISPYKKLFRLNNFKQKSIEKFLGINRDDTEDGGSLIPIYQSYIGKRRIEKLKGFNMPEAEDKSLLESTELLDVLLLHNEDDLKGLIMISHILAYIDIFKKPISIIGCTIEDNKLLINFQLSSSIPVRISLGNDLHYFSAFGKAASLSSKIFEGKMKYFYDDYKDYYYLPREDKAIHKSIALYVDKDFREKAKASNCYTKKDGVFIPLYKDIFTPIFRRNYEDKKIGFIELTEDFISNKDKLYTYTNHLLDHMLSI